MKHLNFHINSQEELIEAINFTSGSVGVEQFKNKTDMFEFLKWYIISLLCVPKEKQELGKKVINKIVDSFLEQVKIMSEFPNQ